MWGGAAALLLLVLAASFVLSGSSVSSAEAAAQARAENLASSVVEEQLTTDLLARDIDGTDYRDLTVRVQAGILSDDRFEVGDARSIYDWRRREMRESDAITVELVPRDWGLWVCAPPGERADVGDLEKYVTIESDLP